MGLRLCAARHWLAMTLLLVLCAGTPFEQARAQAPTRSLYPLPRPAAPVTPPAATTLPRAEPSGALTRSPLPAARPETTQVPLNMVPVRPVTQATAPAATGAAPFRPRPRPSSPPAAPGQTAFEPGPDVAATLPPRPGVVTAPVPLEAASPLAPRRSLIPPRRSPAAFARFTQARQDASLAAPVAGGTGRVTGGLCGVPGLEGRPLPRVVSRTQGCGIDEPVSVTAVAGVRLSQPATLECDTARAFDAWVRQAMLLAMGRAGGGVTQIRVAAHYSCRPRNNRAGARISEHGRGRAIDISGFRLANGENVTILGDWRRGAHSRALRQMHAAACGIFRTTLGPGSDGYHEDHLHFDLARRRNNSTYCR